MSEVCIVDGTYQLHRSVYSGSSNLKTSKGEKTGPLYTFLSILKPLKRFGHIIVCFDYGHSEFRKRLYPEYKQREVTEDLLQVREFVADSNQKLSSLLPKMGIPVVQIQGEEGDDVIFRLSEYFADLKFDVTVVTDDKDYYQFVNKGVKIYRPIADEFVIADTFEANFGFKPEFFVLWKAIVGDKSDNIDGVYKVGEKTATKIMNELSEPTIEDLHKWAIAGKKTVHERVRDSFSIIKRNVLLMDLDRIPLTQKEVAMAYKRAKATAIPDADAVQEEFNRLEFNTQSDWITYLR